MELKESNWIPAGYRIKVKLRPVEAKYCFENGQWVEKTASGLVKRVLTNTEIEREQNGTEIGDVVEIGQCAYKDLDSGKSWVRPGDTVLMAKYAGFTLEDPDTGDTYSFLNDKDIIAYQRGNND